THAPGGGRESERATVGASPAFFERGPVGGAGDSRGGLQVVRSDSGWCHGPGPRHAIAGRSDEDAADAGTGLAARPRSAVRWAADRRLWQWAQPVDGAALGEEGCAVGDRNWTGCGPGGAPEVHRSPGAEAARGE